MNSIRTLLAAPFVIFGVFTLFAGAFIRGGHAYADEVISKLL